jgi:hypothetical protein
MSVSVELEKAGIPSVVIATRPFADACKGIAKANSMPNMKHATVEHPIGSLNEVELMERAESAVGQIVEIVTDKS